MNIDISDDNADNIFCYLSDWLTATSNARRNKGESYKYRYAIVANKFCWGIVELREAGATVYHAYATSIEDICPLVKSACNLNMSFTLNVILQTLKNNVTEQKAEIEIPQNNVDQILEAARKIDAIYKTDYAIHNDVREYIFKNHNTESAIS